MDASQITVERVVAGLAFLAALFERLRSRKKELRSEAELELISDAKRLQERADLLAKLADDNAVNFSKEHTEHQKTRLFWHGEAEKWNAKLLELQDKPDYRDILELISQQNQTCQGILMEIKAVVDLIKSSQSK